jgi:gluconokinase
MTAPRAVVKVVVMGVSGCGKSTVGRLLAEGLGVHYVEGDELHPPENVARMAAGTPLTDADRHGWLQAVAGQLANATTHARGVVVTCSALKRRYRDQLRAGAPDTRFIHLHGPRELLVARLADRTGHYMPPSLLQSQLDTLEPPGPDERALTLSIEDPPEQLAAQARAWLTSTP